MSHEHNCGSHQGDGDPAVSERSEPQYPLIITLQRAIHTSGRRHSHGCSTLTRRMHTIVAVRPHPRQAELPRLAS